MSVAVVFAAGLETEADTYLDWCDANNPDETPGATWYPNDRFDKHVQRVVAYHGPGGLHSEIMTEPPAGVTARGPGVIVDNVEWPISEA